jgi:hypothetical protein
VFITATPPHSQVLHLEFGARSLVPRTVVVRQEGRETWRGPIGPERTLQSVPVQLVDGHATLEFSTDTPGVPENTGAQARQLAFAVYDPRLTLPDSPR